MAKKIHVCTVSSIDIFNAAKPRFNGYAYGHGAHKNKHAYDRRQSKAQLRRELRDE